MISKIHLVENDCTCTFRRNPANGGDKIYMYLPNKGGMPEDEKVALEISIVKKRKYITSTHSINIDHLTEEQVDEFAKILYDKAVMLLINYYPHGQKKETEK